TGNFGNVFAAYVAKSCGFPIGQLAIGSNQNDILTRFFETGTMKIGPVFATLSPSMDIQISSNFERYLFELWNRSGSAVAEIMKQFRQDGRFTADSSRLARARQTFLSSRVDDNETKAIIRDVYETSGRLIDPHSAIGLAAARAAREKAGDMPMVAVATAHPAKFADAVEDATGVRPELPERLADLFDRPERVTSLPNELAAIKRFIASARVDNGVRA
ncbi:MAG: threonine synthase, partial [Hyphomicrobiales bacterium]|nr:threonine synthase [Hyphomicrobiales bacterium]